MLTHGEAIDTIESVLRDASNRATKPLRPDAVTAFRAEAIAAYVECPARFPTAAILAKFVKIRTAARPSTEAQGQADPPADAKRKRVGHSRKPILNEMSPGGENALRRLEGE